MDSNETEEYEAVTNPFGQRDEHLRGTIEFARDAIKLIILINGAAAISILTFIGNFSPNNSLENSMPVKFLIAAVCAFTFGVFAGALSSRFALQAQYLNFEASLEENLEQIDIETLARYHENAFSAATISLLLFVLGIVFSILGIALKSVSP